MGANGSDRADIVNLVFGKALLPADAFSGSIQFVHSDVFSCRAVTESRDVHEIDDPAKMGMLAEERLVYTEIGFPDDMLSKVSILSLNPPGVASEFEAALNWIFSRTDILVWYTDTWTEHEHQFWSMVPIRFKDHSYLCTSADSGIAAPSAPLKPVFRSKMPLDLPFARQVVADGMSDAKRLRECGAYGLITAIRKDISAAKREAEDQITLLAQKYPGAIETARTSLAAKRDAAEPEAPAAAPAALQAEVAAEDHAADAPCSVTQLNPPAQADSSEQTMGYDPTQLIQALEKLDDDLRSEVTSDVQNTFRKASEVLIEAAEDMRDHAKDCAATMELRQLAEDTSDTLQLLSFESDPASCPNGINVLISFKQHARELQVGLAPPCAAQPLPATADAFEMKAPMPEEQLVSQQ